MSYADSWDSWTDEDVWTLTDDDEPTEDDRLWWDEETRDDDQSEHWTEAEDADAIADQMAEEAAMQDAYERGLTYA
jgi:hypothetical protein